MSGLGAPLFFIEEIMSRGSERFEDVEVAYDEVRHETDKAYLFVIDTEKIWIPKSQISHMNDDTFVIPRWLAEENGL
jgi:hypothetical protein